MFRVILYRFRQMCILSGCDYLPSLPGIGLRKAYKFFRLRRHGDIKTVLLSIAFLIVFSHVVKKHS